MKFPILVDIERAIRLRPWLCWPIRRTLAPLMPQTAIGFDKVRIGAARDGGYVMLDHFQEIAAAVSLGIGGDDSWDVAIADRGIPVLQYDHTVDAAPSAHPRCRFCRQRIVPASTGRADETTIAQIVAPLAGDLILKMDIEGDEWGVLAAVDGDVLARFRQIVCEFHGFSEVGRARWRARVRPVLRKLAATHAAIHIHGNNALPRQVVGLYAVPHVIEVTFLRRAGHRLVRSRERFPTALDRPNDPSVPELPLSGVLPRANGGRRHWLRD